MPDVVVGFALVVVVVPVEEPGQQVRVPPRVVADGHGRCFDAVFVAAAERQRDEFPGGRVAHEHMPRAHGQRDQAVAVRGHDRRCRGLLYGLLEHDHGAWLPFLVEHDAVEADDAVGVLFARNGEQCRKA